MSVADLTSSAQDYLKSIWMLSEWSDAPVTTTMVAEHMGVRASSVSDALRKLSKQGLVDHQRYGAVALTQEGERLAVLMVRRHRLIETFLVTVLNLDWDEVHDEAENLEHAVSDVLVERINDFLDHPTRDPHGDPIPSADGTISYPDAVSLSEVSPGCTIRVERMSDSHPDMLRYLSSRGIVPGTVWVVEPPEPYSSDVWVRHPNTRERMTVGQLPAQALYVSVQATGTQD